MSSEAVLGHAMERSLGSDCVIGCFGTYYSESKEENGLHHQAHTSLGIYRVHNRFLDDYCDSKVRELPQNLVIVSWSPRGPLVFLITSVCLSVGEKNESRCCFRIMGRPGLDLVRDSKLHRPSIYSHIFLFAKWVLEDPRVE
jgi:hypothetical protein